MSSFICHFKLKQTFLFAVRDNGIMTQHRFYKPIFESGGQIETTVTLRRVDPPIEWKTKSEKKKYQKKFLIKTLQVSMRIIFVCKFTCKFSDQVKGFTRYLIYRSKVSLETINLTLLHNVFHDFDFSALTKR